MAAGSGGRRRAGDGARAAVGAQAPPGTAEPAVVRDFPDSAVDAAGLTQRQRRILEVIREAVDKQGYPPSVREIGQAVGLTSTSSVAHQLSTLERKGYIRRDPNRPRAVDVRQPETVSPPARLPEPDDEAERFAHPAPTYVPVVGRIAAGGPVLAEQYVEDVFPLPRELVGEGTLFLLRVAGDSMIDGEATVKTYRRRDGHVWLLPHNPAYAPIPGDEATVLGRVVTVLRKV